MIIGQTINADYGSTRQHFTPWFPRVADNAVFTFERIFSTLGLEETVDVFHKQAEDSGTGASVANFSKLGSTDLYEASCSNLKEMIRFRIQIKDTSGWLHFRFLSPTWYPTGKV